ncbi:hypothetical protein [Nonomuraea cavernae]|uniref:Uncharacterized protein n=1 Tax=Nonomuraea cavernae TaxID=2045107 RepID=A0A917YQ43_9ACTN|nr:hypothetical protein [Nonomuraea cavernae]MCA2183644.1 hypothetical protein [Nonomuraea cavernae]GGO60922.1 hypothetical protein GCM10012289_01930 [Nonomuraea cavernae]
MALHAVQALLGLISSDVIAVAVRVEKDRFVLTFWVRRRTSELDDDIDQVVFELDAMFSDEHPLIEPEVHEGTPDPTMLNAYGRMVYWAKYTG